jgi:hypothetical protein
MSNHTTRTTLPPPHLRWWHCDHEGPGLEGCPVCRPGHDREAGLWAAGLLRALERESLALVGGLATDRDRERRRAEAAEAALATARAEVDRLRVFASHVGTIVGADPSDLKALEAALKQIILTIGAQRWTVDDVARLDDELREKMSRALEGARATARAEGAAAERAAVVRMLGKYRDHAERLGLADESVVLAEVLEVIDAEAHLDQPEGA